MEFRASVTVCLLAGLGLSGCFEADDDASTTGLPELTEYLDESARLAGTQRLGQLDCCTTVGDIAVLPDGSVLVPVWVPIGWHDVEFEPLIGNTLRLHPGVTNMIRVDRDGRASVTTEVGHVADVEVVGEALYLGGIKGFHDDGPVPFSAFVERQTMDGDVVWTRNGHHYATNIYEGLEATSDGVALLLESSEPSISWPDSDARTRGPYDRLLVRFDPDGNVLLAAEVPGDSGANAMALDGNNTSILVAGAYGDPGADGVSMMQFVDDTVMTTHFDVPASPWGVGGGLAANFHVEDLRPATPTARFTVHQVNATGAATSATLESEALTAIGAPEIDRIGDAIRAAFWNDGRPIAVDYDGQLRVRDLRLPIGDQLSAMAYGPSDVWILMSQTVGAPEQWLYHAPLVGPWDQALVSDG